METLKKLIVALGDKVDEVLPLAVVVVLAFLKLFPPAVVITLAAFVLVDRIQRNYFRTKEKELKIEKKKSDCINHETRI